MSDSIDGTREQSPEDLRRLGPVPTFAAGDPVPGLNSWLLERKLGGGGFGEVWLARHALSAEQKPRAVKFCTDPVARHRLVTHERNVVARVMRYAGDQPNIVPLLEYNLDGPIPWLMYEYVEGGTLAEAIEGWRTLSMSRRLGKAVRALHSITGALAQFHRFDPPLVHRDLKPQNVLMSGGQIPRITDFGIGGVAVPARQLSATRTHTAHSARVPTGLYAAGTRSYAPPEQLLGSPPDPRDDVYAMGIIAYQMLLADVTAVPGVDAALELRALKVPSALVSLIVPSIAMNAERRPRDAGEWEAELASIIAKAQQQTGAADVGTAAPPPLPPTRPASPSWSQAVARTTPPPVPGATLELPLPLGLRMVFCWVPPGKAHLGSPLVEQNAVAEQVGRREAWLAAESELLRGQYTSKGFWLGKYPVTQAQWYAITGTAPSYFQGGSGGGEVVRGLDTTTFPIERVSWEMICGDGGFLERLNTLDGADEVFGRASAFVLPHENAWEYACRGGLGNQRAFHFGQELNGTQANVDGRQPFGTVVTKQFFKLFTSSGEGPFVGHPTPVGAYEPHARHPWGLCDMHGNVLEWCGNSDGPSGERVLRGGSWRHPPRECRSAFRFCLSPGKRDKFIGFRVQVVAL